jgi:hypothetical protein
MRFLFLILSHREIGFIADAQYHASDILADVPVGTIRNPSRYVPHCFTDKFLFPYQLQVKLTGTP